MHLLNLLDSPTALASRIIDLFESPDHVPVSAPRHRGQCSRAMPIAGAPAHAVACGASVPLPAVAKAVIEGPATCLLCYRTQLAMPMSSLWMQ